MCRDCGCSPTPASDHHHHHHDEPGHHHHHHHGAGNSTVIPVHQAVLHRNDAQAEANRRNLKDRGTLVLNLLSSPGSGKTRLLERTLADLRGELRMGVIVGDVQTDNDAVRLRGKGSPVVGIATGTMCHLEAGHVARALVDMGEEALEVLFIENVGNLVCPAVFDLGEAVRVVLLSVTEGEDKPCKYPEAFKSAHLVLLTKIDMAEAAEFDRDLALENVRRVAPQAEILEVSARTGEGLADWYRKLHELQAAADRPGSVEALPSPPVGAAI